MVQRPIRPRPTLPLWVDLDNGFPTALVNVLSSANITCSLIHCSFVKLAVHLSYATVTTGATLHTSHLIPKNIGCHRGDRDCKMRVQRSLLVGADYQSKFNYLHFTHSPMLSFKENTLSIIFNNNNLKCISPLPLLSPHPSLPPAFLPSAHPMLASPHLHPPER